MAALILYLVYAKFSPRYQAIYYPIVVKNQPITSDHPAYCESDSDCVVDACRGCAVVNREHLSGNQICLVVCPIEVNCLNHQCLGVAR